MGDRDEARRTADAQVCALLLDEFVVAAKDEAELFVFEYRLKAKVRGGGFDLCVAKADGTVTRIVRYQ